MLLQSALRRAAVTLACLLTPSLAMAANPSPMFDGLKVNGVAGLQGFIASTIATPSSLTDLQTSPPANGLFAHGAGTFLQYCSVTGCLSGPHLLSQSLVQVTTRKDASAQEVALAVNVLSGTGKAEPWAPSTSYAAAVQVHATPSGGADGIYQAGAACKSGTAGPTGTAGTSSDGTCTWTYVGPGLNDGKSAFSTALDMIPGSGHGWSSVSDLVVQAGVGNVNAFGYENDCSNYNKDSSLGSPFLMTCFFQGGQGSGTFPMLGYRYVAAGGTSTYGAHFGDLFSGDNTIQDATIADATSAAYVIHAFGGSHVHAATYLDETSSPTSLQVTGTHNAALDVSGATFKTATVNDPSTSPAALNSVGTKSIADLILGASSPNAIVITGAKSAADISDSATGPIGLNMTGTHTAEDVSISTNSPAAVVLGGSHSLASLLDNSTSGTGLYLAGTYSAAQIQGKGFSVDPVGNVVGGTFRGSSLSGGSSMAVCASANGTLYTHAVGGC